MRALRLAAAAFALLPAALATPALAYPGGFGCLWPVNNLFEDLRASRYYTDSAERIYRLTIYVNEPAPTPKDIFDDQGISIGVGSPGPHKVAVCEVVPPHLESTRRGVEWREVGVPLGHNSQVFKNIDIREAGNGGALIAWLVIRAKKPTVVGSTTIEFHVYTGYSNYAG